MKKAVLRPFGELRGQEPLLILISVRLFFDALQTDDVIRAFGHPSEIKALVLLHELEMQQVTFREAIYRLDPHDIVRLIGEIGSLNEGDAFPRFEDTAIETVEIVPIAPFPCKLSRVLQVVDVDTKLLVVLWLHFNDFLQDHLFLNRGFHIKPLETVARALPDGREMHFGRGRVVDHHSIVALHRAVKLLGVFFGKLRLFLSKTTKCQQYSGNNQYYSLHIKFFLWFECAKIAKLILFCQGIMNFTSSFLFQRIESLIEIVFGIAIVIHMMLGTHGAVHRVLESEQ